MIDKMTKKERNKLLNTELQDDTTAYGGISFVGETLRDFLDDVGLSHDLSIDDINLALKSCGIKEINIWG